MKRKTSKQFRTDLRFAVNEEYFRLSAELMTLIKRGVHPKSERITKLDVESVATNIGIPTLRKLSYEQFQKQLQQLDAKLNS